MSTVKPFIKWVGGKRQLLPELLPHLQKLAPQPSWTGRYFEPFIGGGAVFFALSASGGFAQGPLINDYNPELVNLYQVVKAQPVALFERLKDAIFANTPEAHAAIRAWDRQADWPHRSAMDRAARFIYLNRTSFNGLWRVNKSGGFNVPFGRYANPGFPSLETLVNASEALKSTEIRCGDFEDAVADAVAGDLVYFDPPYFPVSPSSNFVGYTDKGFDVGMQDRLALVCDRLTQKGVAWVLSNADVPQAHALYGRQPGAAVHVVTATRSINSKASGRGRVGEIIAVGTPVSHK